MPDPISQIGGLGSWLHPALFLPQCQPIPYQLWVLGKLLTTELR